jgi:hypothetical protein
MVLHVNPTSMSFSYEKTVERIQTKGGYVEQHWGDGALSISFNMVTGGFKRLFSGLSNVTGGGFNTSGTRRETIAYDKYLDMLALFKSNGAIYDTRGQIVFTGLVKVTFDGGIYFGWFSAFNVTEAAEKPYQFDLTAEFTVSHEILRVRSYITPEPGFYQGPQDTSRYETGVDVIGEAPTPPPPKVVEKEPEEEKATDPTKVEKKPKKKRKRRRRRKKTNAETPPPPEPTSPQQEMVVKKAHDPHGSRSWRRPQTASAAVAAIQLGKSSIPLLDSADDVELNEPDPEYDD